MAVPYSCSPRYCRSDSFPILSIAPPSKSPEVKERHIIAVVGPRLEAMVKALTDECRRMGLSLRLVHTDDDEFGEAAMDALHANGEFGPMTQLIAMAHGKKEAGCHKIETMQGRSDDSLVFLQWLRLGQDRDPVTDERLPWTGIAHVLSCDDGVLAGLIAGSAEALDCGPNLIHGGEEALSKAEACGAIRNICEFIHAHRFQTQPSPRAALAWVARTAAVPVTLIGGEVRSPVIVQPAGSVIEAMPGYLSGQLKQLQVQGTHDAVARRARHQHMDAVADAILPQDERLASTVLEEQLVRIAHEQVFHDDLDKLKRLLEEVPPLVHTVNAYRVPLHMMVVPERGPAYEKVFRAAARSCHASGPQRATGHEKSPPAALRKRNRPIKKGIASQNGGPDTVIAAAVRRLVKEPGYFSVLLQKACAQGDVAMLGALYGASGPEPFRQASLIRRCSQEAMPPLHLACLIREPELVATLLENGADVDQPDRDGKTALHHAVLGKSLAVVRMLIGANADVTISADGKTPVHLAASLQFDAAFSELATSAFWGAGKTRQGPLPSSPSLKR